MTGVERERRRPPRRQAAKRIIDEMLSSLLAALAAWRQKHQTTRATVDGYDPSRSGAQSRGARRRLPGQVQAGARDVRPDERREGQLAVRGTRGRGGARR